MNNGTPHDYSLQEYACDFTGCTYYFDNHVLNTNKIRATLNGKNVLLFSVKESSDSVEIYITIPDDFHCFHYKKGGLTNTCISENTHLTYHGKSKRKKITGEIHISSDGSNPLKGESEKTEAPVASSSDIKTHPLPICRVELSRNIGNIKSENNITNYFEVQSKTCFFNTIEVHLAHRGYIHELASVSRNIPNEFSSLFIHTNMEAFYHNRISHRPGYFPQVLTLQTKKFELIILAINEYKNPSYNINSIRYFHTKDYFRDLCNRNIMSHQGGFFIDQLPNLLVKKDRRFTKLSAVLNTSINSDVTR